jgi:hypothetical protein
MNIRELLQTHRNLLLKRVVYEELLKWVESDFLSSDGMKAKNIMVTNDGLAVPEDVISSVINEITTSLVSVLNAEIARIEETKVGETNEV